MSPQTIKRDMNNARGVTSKKKFHSRRLNKTEATPSACFSCFIYNSDMMQELDLVCLNSKIVFPALHKTGLKRVGAPFVPV